jgi:hypothetical protein
LILKAVARGALAAVSWNKENLRVRASAQARGYRPTGGEAAGMTATRAIGRHTGRTVYYGCCNARAGGREPRRVFLADAHAARRFAYRRAVPLLACAQKPTGRPAG